METAKRIYEHNNWSVIERLTEYGKKYSVVRAGSVFFEHTFISLTEAIEFCDTH